jgi:hypothetical protein
MQCYIITTVGLNNVRISLSSESELCHSMPWEKGIGLKWSKSNKIIKRPSSVQRPSAHKTGKRPTEEEKQCCL